MQHVLSISPYSNITLIIANDFRGGKKNGNIVCSLWFNAFQHYNLACCILDDYCKLQTKND